METCLFFMRWTVSTKFRSRFFLNKRPVLFMLFRFFLIYFVTGMFVLTESIFMLFYQFNRTYELMNFNVKKESEDFPIFVGNGVYLSLLADSKIKEISNDSVPELRFNFLKIEEIKSLAINSKCGWLI